MSKIFQIKVTLAGSKPPIWRRFQVADDVKLSKLHRILQDVMGWTDSHMHQFLIAGETYVSPELNDDIDELDEQKTKLHTVVKEAKDKFRYEYDFGDSWEHVLEVEKVLPAEPGVHYPRCLTGKRACPPEDCGGIWGYADFVEAIQNPEHPEHEELLEWVGGAFDPEAFNLDEVNDLLKQYR